MRLDHLLSKEEQVESCFVVQLSSENLITAFRVAMRSGDTPVPIPNTMVKTWAADGTMLETAWESRWLPDFHGGLAQLGERLPCKQEVTSSNLVFSTRLRSRYGLIAQPVRAHA